MKLLRVPQVDIAEISIIGEAREARDKIVARAKLLTRVSNAVMQKTAVDVGIQLRRMISDTEAARVEVKTAPLAACKTIDGLAADFVKSLRAELSRIEMLLGDFAAAERKRLAEIETARLAEESKRKAEAEAEAKRLLDQAEAKAAATPDPVQAQQHMDAAAMHNKQLLANASLPGLFSQPVKPTGLRTGQQWNCKVNDVWALAAHDRSLVRIEPNMYEIKRLIAAGTRDLPGCEITEDTRATIVAR